MDVPYRQGLASWGLVIVFLHVVSCRSSLSTSGPWIPDHRLIPSRAWLIGHLFRRAGHQSFWAPACQDQAAGGRAGVGVVSLGAAH